MGSSFTALPLGSGEAFLLQTQHAGKHWTILVDSGNLSGGSRRGLVAAINKAAPCLRHIDIAICTHHDMDHARGFRTFSDEWCSARRTIGEFWLPGRWSAAVPEVLFQPLVLAYRIWRGAVGVSNRLVDRKDDDAARMTGDEQLCAVARDIGLQRSFSEVIRRGQPRKVEGAETEPQGRAHIDQLARSLGVTHDELRALDSAIENRDRQPSTILHGIGSRSLPRFQLSWWLELESRRWLLAISLFSQTIETAKTIAAIAECAVRWRIPVRWFDFGQFEETRTPSGGIDGFLVPVSAVELRSPPPPVSDEVLFLCLRLSQQNVESLVFHRLESDTEPGVMFLGDSRLSFGVDRPQAPFPMPADSPKRPILVTAPHHGSRVNDAAYGVIRAWLGGNEASSIYIRNGGHHKQTVGAFLDQPCRCCAQCRLCSPRRLARTVTLISRRGRWIWPAKRVPICRIGSA